MPPIRFKGLYCSGAMLLALAACSPEPASTGSDADLTATMPDKIEPEDQALIDQLQKSHQETFMARCAEGQLPSQDGEPSDPAECTTAYAKADRSKDAAHLLIRAFSPDGAARGDTVDTIRSRLSQVRWTEETTGGSTLASGRLGDFEAVVTGSAKPASLALNWNGPAGEVPVDIVNAFTLYGAKADLVACHSGGGDERGRAWRITPAMGSAFNITEFSRAGPSGTAVSSYSASASLDDRPLTLQALRAGDSEWNVCG